MSRQPTLENVGNVAVSGERRIGSYDVTPWGRGAEEIAQAGAQFGRTIGGIGDAAHDALQKRDQTQYVNALARGLTKGIDLRTALRSNPDPDAIGQLWNDGSGKIIDDEAQGIDNARLREALRAKLGEHFAREHASVAAQAFRGRADAARAAIAEDRQKLIDTTAPDGEPLHDAKIDVHNALIDTAELNGYLDPAEALAEKQRSAHDITVALYRVMGRLDPARAINELTDTKNPSRLLGFLPTDETDDLFARADANQKAREIDAERAEHLTAIAAQRTSDQTEGTYLKGLLSDDPSVTAKAIVNDDALTPAAKERLVSATARTVQSPPLIDAPGKPKDKANQGFFDRNVHSGAADQSSYWPHFEDPNDSDSSHKQFEVAASTLPRGIPMPPIPPDLIPGTPQWADHLIRGLRGITDLLGSAFAKKKSADPNDYCYERFYEEEKRCHESQWQVAHPDYTAGCVARAKERLYDCIANGGKPRSGEPREWRPGADGDEETWINPDR
jgi:hypothetical protein